VRGETYTGRGVAIDFAPRRNIPRSVKPLVAFCVRAGDASFAYIEGAALEAELDYAEILSAHKLYAENDFFVSLEPHLQLFSGLNALVGRSFENPYQYNDAQSAFTDAVMKFKEII
jgi:hypothetical protein